MIDTSDIGVFPGLDVGKGEHHATAVTPAGKKAFDKRLPNSEPQLRELFEKLQAEHGTVLVINSRPAQLRPHDLNGDLPSAGATSDSFGVRERRAGEVRLGHAACPPCARIDRSPQSAQVLSRSA
ncbi:hypothetical protein GCM10010251_87360 [Streptomyces aurantiogriseus]|uniref:Transposase IS110-like N-terminal domain-containing protein n=1 Tax=Streptomyces aurantiogriseus TaxID=66870 RepID=A0A918FN65_9ACTN|nr:hypothetical protein GCM10010251_87360 [Streptomyces aurantiogriseus]